MDEKLREILVVYFRVEPTYKPTYSSKFATDSYSDALLLEPA
jgi:hypothetical protein